MVIVKRKIYVCFRCEAIYADEPVSECDCEIGAREFIEGVAKYRMPCDECANTPYDEGPFTLA